MNELRVLLLAENGGMGGINSYVILIAEGLRAHGISVEIGAVWPKPDNWLQIQCEQKGFPLTVLAAKRSVFQFPRCIYNLARMIRDRRYAIVHTQGHYSDLVGRAAYLLSGQPTRMVATVHGIAEDPRLALKLFYWLDWRTYRWNHATIANSRDTAHRLQQLGVKTKDLTVILHGVVTRAEAYRLRKMPVPKRAPEEAIPTIGFVGRLSWEKRCSILIEAIHILKERGRRFKLVVVGDGPERPYLEGQVVAYGLESEVTFEGWRANVLPYYRRADVIAVPSLKESLGLTILEAMLHGRAVVACRVRGIPEIVSDNETGILVNPDDPVGLADALERCLTDPQLRARLGEAGRRYVLKHHTIEAMIDAVIGVYDRVLGSNSNGEIS